MASKIKKGESIYIPFIDGESVLDSQNRPRMYKSVEQFKKSYPGYREGAPNELVEYAPVVRGRWIDYSEPNEDGNCQCYCSNCYAGDVQRVGEKVPYCWKCGAKMDLE